jgi:putative holliday junction resolvase
VRILGVDTGERRVGLALSDPTGTVAQPLAVAVLAPGDDIAAVVAEAATRHGAEGLVIGLPRHMNGDEGDGARRARALAADLRERLGLPVDLWDERLSTVAAHRALREGGVSGRRRKDKVDKTAAALILQGYLDSRRRSETTGPNRFAP